MQDRKFADAVMRRHFLQMLTGGIGTAAFSALIPARAHGAAIRDPRFVTIILRGALDGLAAVPAVGDTDFAAIRAPFETGQTSISLNNLFALHPSMRNLARFYKANQALIIHAAATPYRDRSHFDGQDVLESGQPSPGQTDSGWLNRFLLTIKPEQKVSPELGLAVGSIAPLTIRGKAPVLGWAPSSLKPINEDLVTRLHDLYAAGDASLDTVLNEAILTNKIASRAENGSNPNTKAASKLIVETMNGLGNLLVKDDGPRVAAMALDGWDTHITERQRLSTQLTTLDDALGALETTLGPVWHNTVVLVVTEFGRTVAINGTSGTDHGTGTVAFLVGGAVNGGRVIADWPGLKVSQLYQARDLMPTTDIRAVAMGVLSALYDVPDTVLQTKIFPGAAHVRPMQALVA